MPKMFVLIRKRGSKRFFGAIPIRKGQSVSKVRASVRRNIKPGFTFIIVTAAKLKNVIARQRPRTTRRRKRRRVRRRARRRRKRPKRRRRRKRRKKPRRRRRRRRRRRKR